MEPNNERINIHPLNVQSGGTLWEQTVRGLIYSHGRFQVLTHYGNRYCEG